MILHEEPAEVWRCITSWGEEFCAPATVKRGAERKATAHGDVYFHRPHTPFNFVSDAATSAAG
jgi:hypothetical protein